MSKALMACCFFLLLLSLVWACRDRPAADPPQADKRLSLSTPEHRYLLGEPVVLNLTFTNPAKEPMKVVEVFVEPGHYETPIWIAFQGDAYKEFVPNIGDFGRTRRVYDLAPGGSLRYQCRVVARPWKDVSLAFPKVGKYRVYVEYPLTVVGALQNSRIASNVVNVTIDEPIGEDATVWRQLKEPALLTLLQTEAIDVARCDIPMNLARLVRSYPTSGYAAALRHALAGIYFRQRFKFPKADQDRLAQSLEIADVESLADDRLEARRKDQLPSGTSLVKKETPLVKVLALLSEAGIPLDADPELRDRKVNIGVAYRTIRLGMRLLSDELEASWERRGNGYFLAPYDPANPKRLKVKGGR